MIVGANRRRKDDATPRNGSRHDVARVFLALRALRAYLDHKRSQA